MLYNCAKITPDALFAPYGFVTTPETVYGPRVPTNVKFCSKS